LSVPGIRWVLACTIAGEIGEIERFSSPEKPAGYTDLCPRVNQSGEKDRRGLRGALLEVTMHALKHPAYAERYQRNKRRLGKQRGATVAQIDIARRLSHAIWHMPSRVRSSLHEAPLGIPDWAEGMEQADAFLPESGLERPQSAGNPRDQEAAW
jgi:hypothetical protein